MNGVVRNEYKEKDDRVEVFFQENNLGVVKNFEFLTNFVDLWKKVVYNSNIEIIYCSFKENI